LFGLGVSEIFMILAIALVVVGPKRLPEVARTLGKIMAQLRKAGDEFRETINREVYGKDGIDTFLRQNPYKDMNESASGSGNAGEPAGDKAIDSPEEQTNDENGEEENLSSVDKTQAEQNER